MNIKAIVTDAVAAKKVGDWRYRSRTVPPKKGPRHRNRPENNRARRERGDGR